MPRRGSEGHLEIKGVICKCGTDGVMSKPSQERQGRVSHPETSLQVSDSESTEGPIAFLCRKSWKLKWILKPFSFQEKSRLIMLFRKNKYLLPGDFFIRENSLLLVPVQFWLELSACKRTACALMPPPEKQRSAQEQSTATEVLLGAQRQQLLPRKQIEFLCVPLFTFLAINIRKLSEHGLVVCPYPEHIFNPPSVCLEVGR